MKRIIQCIMLVAVGIVGLSHSAIAQQPFANVQSAPTTSPYLTLTTRNGQSNGFAAYQNYVQPQLQQQQVNAQNAQQIQHLQQQAQKNLTSGGGPGGAGRGISTNIRGTGHLSTYMDYLHYYGKFGGGQAQTQRQ
jgi:hypothetical protein